MTSVGDDRELAVHSSLDLRTDQCHHGTPRSLWLTTLDIYDFKRRRSCTIIHVWLQYHVFHKEAMLNSSLDKRKPHILPYLRTR